MYSPKHSPTTQPPSAINANLSSLFREGFTVDSFSHSSPDALIITLSPEPDFAPVCRRCGRRDCAVHDVSVRRVRERDLLHWRVTLLVPVRRLRCACCGVATERISWLPERRRYTSALADWVESLTRLLPVKHVAQLTGLHWHTIKKIDHHRLRREWQEPDRRQLRRLIMDEFALFNGHRYALLSSMPTHSACCGLAKAGAARLSARFSPGWGRKVAQLSSLSQWI